MPRKEINYTNTVIYKIVCNDLTVTDLYVGHTTDFTKRKNTHKSNCNNVNDKHYNFKVYKIIRDNGGWTNWTMVEIEKYECNDGNEAKARERYYLELLNAQLNSTIPGRSQKQHYEQNKEAKLLKQKQHYEQNKEAKLLKQKQHYEQNKEARLLYQKQYDEANKEARLLKAKEYYDKNKEEISLKNKQKYIKKKSEM
jgi:hypothetical protein